MGIDRTLTLKSTFQTNLLNEKFEAIPLSVNRKNLNFALVKLKSNNFDYKNLIKYLENASVYYALPQKRIDELKSEGLLKDLIDETKEKFKSSKYNEGEGGELISYCINEDILHAPKILSKLKLKTNNEDYVKGADGVHLLKLDDNTYEVIFAESKMYKDLKQAVTKAFESIDRFISGDAIDFEITTLATNLSGEFEDIDVDFISKYILPSKSNVTHHTAFSIFIGFNIDNDLDKSLDYKVYEQQMVDKVRKAIQGEVDHISSKVSDPNRRAHSFYIYLIPFENIEDFRKDIIKGVKGE
jgi:hypothetical protein